MTTPSETVVLNPISLVAAYRTASDCLGSDELTASLWSTIQLCITSYLSAGERGDPLDRERVTANATAAPAGRPSETRDSELVASVGACPVCETPIRSTTKCACCGEVKPCPLRRDDMGGYVCLSCIDKRLDTIDRLTSTGEMIAQLHEHQLADGFREERFAACPHFWHTPSGKEYELCSNCGVRRSDLPLYVSPSEGHVEVPVGVDTDAEWELEQRAFDAANHSDVPEWAQKTVADLWRQYCLATEANQGETKP